MILTPDTQETIPSWPYKYIKIEGFRYNFKDELK